eukprot:3429912-Prymnesium_polylepis.2
MPGPHPRSARTAWCWLLLARVQRTLFSANVKAMSNEGPGATCRYALCEVRSRYVATVAETRRVAAPCASP